jgi:hypothetical protein
MLGTPLNVFLKDHSDLLALQEKILFYKVKKDLRKDRIDNPLKILDFANEISSPITPNAFWVDRTTPLIIKGRVYHPNRF